MKEEIIRLYKSGLSYEKVAKTLGISKATVGYYCSPITRWSPVIGQEELDKIKELSLTHTPVQICKILNLRKSTVYAQIKQLKLPPRKRFLKNEHIANKNKNRARETKLKCVEYKGGKCILCGYNRCVFSLDFHHLNPEEKEFAISGNLKSFESLKSELDKCILVCRNCHGEIHAGLHPEILKVE